MLKWHGGKQPIAAWIRSKFKPHKHYVEPYFGGGAVLFAGLPGCSEVVNDIDGDVMNFWWVVSNPDAALQFASVVSNLPVSETMFIAAARELTERNPTFHRNPVTSRAVAFFILSRQSMGGRMQDWHPLSKRRTRGGMNEQVSAWMGAIAELPTVAYRLRCVALRCAPALQVIEQEDTPDTLHYVDPPYLHETRAAKDVYAHEMSYSDHAELLLTLNACKGQVFLSGYRSPLYDQQLSHWIRHELPVANHAASGESKRTMVECLWEKPR